VTAFIIVVLIIMLSTSTAMWVVLMRRRAALRQMPPQREWGLVVSTQRDGQAVIEVVSQYEWLLREKQGRFRIRVDRAPAGYALPNGGSPCRALVTPGCHTVRSFLWWYASPALVVDVPLEGVRLHTDLLKSSRGVVNLLVRPRRSLYLADRPTINRRVSE
jgi:hypothetical protein